MFDGRESLTLPLNNGQTFPANLNADLTQQAIDATLDPCPGRASSYQRAAERHRELRTRSQLCAVV